MLFSTSSSISSAFVVLAALFSIADAHGVITNVAGANGVAGQGFGVIASTPRDGSSPNPFEQDTSIIRQGEIASGKTGVCGRTKAGGDNDVATQLSAASAQGLPSASADGTVTMTLHQVNQDGAGPYTCQVSTDATGADFAAMTVTQNVPGILSLSTAKATDFPLVAQMPAGTTCTGGPNGDACLVRCTNKAIAGPFGGCVAVTAGNSSSTAASSSVDDATDVDATATDAADATATDAATVDATATEAAATAAAEPTAAAAAADAGNGKGVVGKIFGALGARAVGDLEARMEERVKRSRVFTAGRRA